MNKSEKLVFHANKRVPKLTTFKLAASLKKREALVMLKTNFTVKAHSETKKPVRANAQASLYKGEYVNAKSSLCLGIKRDTRYRMTIKCQDMMKERPSSKSSRFLGKKKDVQCYTSKPSICFGKKKEENDFFAKSPYFSSKTVGCGYAPSSPHCSHNKREACYTARSSHRLTKVTTTKKKNPSFELQPWDTSSDL